MKFKSFLEQLKESDPKAYQQLYNELYDDVYNKVYDQVYETLMVNDDETYDLLDSIIDKFSSGSDFDIDDSDIQTMVNDFNNIDQDFLPQEENLFDLEPDVELPLDYLITDDIYEYDPTPDDIHLSVEQMIHEYYHDYLKNEYLTKSKVICDVYPVTLSFTIFTLLNSKGYKLSNTSLIQTSDLSEIFKMYSNNKVLYFVVNTEEKLFEIYEYKDQFSHLILSYNDNTIMHKLYEDQINSDNNNNSNTSL